MTVHQIILQCGRKKSNMMSTSWMNMTRFITQQKVCWFFSKLWASCQLWEVRQVWINLLAKLQENQTKSLHSIYTGSNLPRTTFQWCSKAFIWAYTIYALETFVVCYIARERINKFLHSPEKKFDEIIYNIIFMSILLPHFLLPVASWRNGAEVAKFKNMWTKYQLQYLRVTGTPIVFPNLYPLTWALCFVSWFASIFIMLSQYLLQPDFDFLHTFAYYHILAMLNGFCSLWFINCTAFGIASKALAANLNKTLESYKPAHKLTEYRHLWGDLSYMMQQLGRAYSNMYGLYCLVIFFTTIIATFGALSEILDHGATFKEFGLFVIVCYCMTLLFIICNEAHHASEKVR